MLVYQRVMQNMFFFTSRCSGPDWMFLPPQVGPSIDIFFGGLVVGKVIGQLRGKFLKDR